MIGVWSDATDDFDLGLDRPLEFPGVGAAAIYHEAEPNGWSGPTDFYISDYREYLDATESKTWSPIHLWAVPGAYTDDTMTLLLEGSSSAPPPNRSYSVELLYVPPEIEGAPAVGTTWEVLRDEVFTVTVPTFLTNDGHEGYRFAFTVGPHCSSEITGDGKVDLSDLAMLLSSYGLCNGDLGYVAKADLVGAGGQPDGCVDLSDLATLLADYGCGVLP